MKDVIIFSIVFVIGYLCFMSIVLVLRRIFFPFIIKEEMTKRGHLALSK
jgi:hypothetical protein